MLVVFRYAWLNWSSPIGKAEVWNSLLHQGSSNPSGPFTPVLATCQSVFWFSMWGSGHHVVNAGLQAGVVRAHRHPAGSGVFQVPVLHPPVVPLCARLVFLSRPQSSRGAERVMQDPKQQPAGENTHGSALVQIGFKSNIFNVNTSYVRPPKI